jgi:hypothetical protein
MRRPEDFGKEIYQLEEWIKRLMVLVKDNKDNGWESILAVHNRHKANVPRKGINSRNTPGSLVGLIALGDTKHASLHEGLPDSPGLPVLNKHVWHRSTGTIPSRQPPKSPV